MMVTTVTGQCFILISTLRLFGRNLFAALRLEGMTNTVSKGDDTKQQPGREHAYAVEVLGDGHDVALPANVARVYMVIQVVSCHSRRRQI